MDKFHVDYQDANHECPHSELHLTSIEPDVRRNEDQPITAL